jgi:hypothetical protein
MRPFKSKVRQRATITGVGFFDVGHGQMGSRSRTESNFTLSSIFS